MTRYSDQEKAAALAALVAHGGRLRATARATGISTRTLARWLKAIPPRESPKSLSQVNSVRTERGFKAEPMSGGRGTIEERLAAAIDQYVDGLPDKLDEANLQQSGRVLLWLLDHYMMKPEAQVSDARERLEHLVDRLAAEGAANGDPEPANGG